MFLSGTNRVLGSGRCSLDSLNMKQFTWLSGLVLLVWSVCKAILYSTICRTSLHSRAQAVFWAEGYHEFSYFTYMMYYYCYPPSPLEPPPAPNVVSFIGWGFTTTGSWRSFPLMVMMPLAQFLQKHEIPCKQFDHKEKRIIAELQLVICPQAVNEPPFE